jgi:hypothetical protein
VGKRNIPAKYQAMYKRAMTGKSRKAAMQVFCAECVGYVAPEIARCTDKGCPMYPYRQITQEIENKTLLEQGTAKIKDNRN